MRKEDIVFLLHPSWVVSHRPPMHFLFLAGYLRKKGYESIILDPHSFIKKGFFSPSKKDFVEIEGKMLSKIKEINPKIICLSSLSAEFMQIVNLTDKIKRICDAKIVIGGSHANAKPKEFLEYSKADFVVYGEGEITLFELVKMIDKEREDFKKIGGLVWRKGKKIIQNKPRAFMENLDEIPVPAYDLIDMEPYLKMWDGSVRGLPLRSLAIYTSRGCPYHCNFCAAYLTFGRRMRFMSKERIEEVVKFLKEKYKVEGLIVMDDTLTVNKQHLKNVSETMSKYNLIWACKARFDNVDDEMIKQLKKDNCVQLDTGVESGSPRILKDIMNKGITVEQVRKVFKLCNKHNMRILANFMIGQPTETREDMERSMNLAKEINADFYTLSIATPLPNTRLYRQVGVDIKPKDYHHLIGALKHPKEWHKRSIGIDELVRIRKEFYPFLKYNMFKKALTKSFLFYLRLWFKLPKKPQRIFYIIKKLVNWKIIMPITKRSLRM